MFMTSKCYFMVDCDDNRAQRSRDAAQRDKQNRDGDSASESLNNTSRHQHKRHSRTKQQQTRRPKQSDACIKTREARGDSIDSKQKEGHRQRRDMP
jgi:hypothetical protein